MTWILATVRVMNTILLVAGYMSLILVVSLAVFVTHALLFSPV